LESPKPKRNRFSQKHRSEGQRLADALRQQRKDFPSFASQLNELIERIVSHSQRTRQSDREIVISVLRDWGALTIRELMEETKLSHWDLRQVLADLIKQGKVIETRPPINGIPPNARPYVYRLKG
jgi:predicted transcriptional regulator